MKKLNKTIKTYSYFDVSMIMVIISKKIKYLKKINQIKNLTN